METKCLRRGVEDRHAENVRGEEVARELDASVFEAECCRERLSQRRLSNAGDVLDQQVTAREQARERKFQRLALADDDAIELCQDGGKPLHDGYVGLVKRADGHGEGSGCEGIAGYCTGEGPV